MRVLLTLPHHNIQNLGYLSYKDSDYPLGLGYVAAIFAREFDPEVLDIYDFQLKNNTIDGLKALLTRKRYDIVGLSVFTPTYGPGLMVARTVKEVLPDCMQFAGGPFMGMNPGEMLGDCPEIDVEFIGESEETIPEVVRALVNGQPLAGIKGIAYRDGNKVIVNERRPLIKDLDSIPFPKRDIFSLDAYTSLPGQFFKKPIIPMTTTRGCPFRCAFCEDHILWQGKCRFRSAENVYAEMEELVKKFGAKEIKFFDDTFSASRRRTVELCELIIKHKLKVIWRVCTRVDTVDEQLLKLMYRAGLRSVNFGVESGSDMILSKMNKGFDREVVRRAVAASKKVGIETKASFILNYPGDTKETTLQTLAFADELDLDFVGYNLFNPLMGRQLKEFVAKNYQINERAWNDRNVSAVNTVFFYQPSLPEEFLAESYKKAMRSHYLKPRNIVKALLRVRNLAMARSYFDGFLRLFRIEICRGPGDAEWRHNP
ncbi:MAG: radical SAM protein [Thermodesulfobacteriota bacterium]|nr:radical SAM protein [Thermodesulfobacteriota bacterium]